MKNAHHGLEKTELNVNTTDSTKESSDTSPLSLDFLEDMERRLDAVATNNKNLADPTETAVQHQADLKNLLQLSLAINSSLVLDDVLQSVMHKAIELVGAERGLIMLLDHHDELQIKSAYNLCKEQMMDEDFKVSNSITSEVTATRLR